MAFLHGILVLLPRPAVADRMCRFSHDGVSRPVDGPEPPRSCRRRCGTKMCRPFWWEPHNLRLWVQPEFAPPEGLEAEMPPWQRTVAVPVFQPPREPRPVGFVRGRAPLLIIDVSGTLSPRLRGQFVAEVAAAAQLLSPQDGEFATQSAFDVIAFATGAHSWSVDYMRCARIVREGRTMLAGRQVRLPTSESMLLPAAAYPCTISTLAC